MDSNTALVVVVYLLGAGIGVFYPYVRKWLENGLAFDWRKVAGKAAAAVLGLVLVPTFAATLEALGGMGIFLAFLAGLGATTVGHEAQATPGAVKAAWHEE